MNPYLTVFRVRARSLLQYRASAAAKLLPPIFIGLVQAMYYTAFFASSPTGQPLTLPQTITYIWVVQLLVYIQPWGGDPEVLAIIRTGTIAYELCRPLDLFGHWFSRLCAQRLVPLALNGLPIALFALLLLPPGYRMGAPASAGSALLFMLSLASVVLLSSAISNILGILTVWTVSGEGLYYIGPVIVMLLSGAVAPLPFFPAGLLRIINLLPFRGLLDTPAQIYLGLIPLGRVPLILGGQLLWTLALVLLGRLLLARALRSVTIQGG